MTNDPDLSHAMSAIGRRQFDEAAALLSELLVRQPGNVRARWLLIQTLESQQQTDSAREQLRLLLNHVGKDLPAIDRIAEHMWRRRYALSPVLRAYEKYLKKRPESSSAAFNFAYYLSRDAQFEAAIRQYKRALASGISAPEEVHLNIANIYMDHLLDHGRARAHFEKALALKPDYASAFYNLGNLAEQEGKRDEARENFEKCLQADPANESALARLADTKKFTSGADSLLTRLAAAARDSSNPDIHFAFGKACEQLGNYAPAWQHFSQGNALDARALPAYRPEVARQGVERIMAQYDAEWLGQFAGESTDPVFICGMFRSGSTLLEQMLAAHPAFFAGGESEFFPRLVARELPAYPDGVASITHEKIRAWRRQHATLGERLVAGSARLTDKRPDNFLYAGLIKAVLPAARFVITERDWRDVATSVYSVRLGAGQAYATDLVNIRHYIDLQTELVNHWASLLGPDLLRIRYEDLVQQPRATMTRLLEWLGEERSERCLSFHTLTNSVKTASVWQVREPLHARSIGRWQHYRQAFAAAFGDDLDD
tara:strand:+ start:9584 stop:11215 length:1632 start_codon:yes stop_codon:yes gene_type:complete